MLSKRTTPRGLPSFQSITAHSFTHSGTITIINEYNSKIVIILLLARQTSSAVVRYRYNCRVFQAQLLALACLVLNCSREGLTHAREFVTINFSVENNKLLFVSIKNFVFVSLHIFCSDHCLVSGNLSLKHVCPHMHVVHNLCVVSESHTFNQLLLKTKIFFFFSENRMNH